MYISNNLHSLFQFLLSYILLKIHFVGPYRTHYRCRHVVLLYFVQSQVWTRYFGTTLTLSRPVDENSNLAGLCDAMTSLENNTSLSVSRVDQAKQHLAAALRRHSNATTHRVLLRNKE